VWDLVKSFSEIEEDNVDTFSVIVVRYNFVEKASRLVTHERPCLKPCCELNMQPNLVRCCVITSLTIDSVTFDK